MSSSNDDDSQQRFALGFLFAIIALVVFTVVGVAVYKYGIARAPVQPVATAASGPVIVVGGVPVTPGVPAMTVTTETVSVVVPEGASINVANGVVNFYFATGSADLAPGAAQALATVIKGVEGGRKAQVSGFHDTTGNAAINEELALLRAQTVRDVLIGLGVAADKVDLQKPAVSAGGGSDAQARRVEVKLHD